MRFLTLFIACAACAANGPPPFIVDGMARADGVRAALPLARCDAATQAGTVLILGSGFVPEVRNALGESPTLVQPKVLLAGPVNVDTASSVLVDYRNPERIAVPIGALPDGLYSVRVMDSDGQSVELNRALEVRPAPSIASVSQGAHYCATQAATLVVTGGPFAPGAQATIEQQPYAAEPVKVVSQTDTSVTVRIPVGVGSYSSNVDLHIIDAAGCAVTAPLTQGCP